MNAREAHQESIGALLKIQRLLAQRKPVPDLLVVQLSTAAHAKMASDYLDGAGYVRAMDGFCGFTPKENSQPMNDYQTEHDERFDAMRYMTPRSPVKWSFGGMDFIVRSGGISDYLRFD